MRLWTIHPCYLDQQGLVAAWREALLAQKVLRGETRGYRHHPQLQRFQEQSEPLAAMAWFLTGLADEAEQRGYQFDRTKILHAQSSLQIEETHGQLLYEWEHLLRKLKARSPLIATRWEGLPEPNPHPLFRVVEGNVRSWEKQ